MVKTISIISGKGGVGKTTVTIGLSQFMRHCVIVDADVSAPDINVMLNSETEKSILFKPKNLAAEIGSECTLCGKCVEACRFKAIVNSGTEIHVRYELCTGCEMCSYVCPVDTIFMKERLAFPVNVASHKFGKILYSEPVPGQRISGGLVSFMRARAERVAEESNLKTILIDASPGKGCYVISAITDSDFTVIVTEPTKAAFKDLESSAELLNYFTQPGGVLVNKADLNDQNRNEIEKFCQQKDLEFLGTIPYLKEYPGYLNQGILPLEINEKDFNNNLNLICENIKLTLEKQGV